MESEPPETETSSTVKSVELSESVKLRVAVSTVLSDSTSELMAMEGGVVSATVVLIESVTVLSASFSS